MKENPVPATTLGDRREVHQVRSLPQYPDIRASVESQNRGIVCSGSQPRE